MLNILDIKFRKSSEWELFEKKYSYFFERLPNFQKALAAAFKTKKQNTKLDRLVFNLCKNSISKFDEFTLLCGNGFGDGALIFWAEMFENFIIARNIHVYPDEFNKFSQSFLLNPFNQSDKDLLDKAQQSLNFFYSSRNPSENWKTNNLSNSWFHNYFVESEDFSGISKELKNAYQLSQEHRHSPLTSLYSLLNDKDFVSDKKKRLSQEQISDIAFTAAYLLLKEVLLLMIEHFNLNSSDPIYQQFLKDYESSLNKDKKVINKSSKEHKSQSKRKNNTVDYKDESQKLLKYIDENKDVIQAVGVSPDDLTYLYILENIKGFGPQKFKRLHESNISPEEVTANPNQLLRYGKAGEGFESELLNIMNSRYEEFRYKALYQIIAAYKNKGFILTYNHPNYPRNVYKSNNPIPILYVRGSLSVLKQNRVVACVGSRNIRSPYNNLQKDFAKEAGQKEFTVVSGFALGADTIAHEAAFNNRGNTICIMPCGLDKPFPPENKDLWNNFLNYDGAAFVTEFPFGIRTSSLTLRKRNKLIVAFALGVLIGQSSVRGGAMNAYRFAREQHKPVATFNSNQSEDTSGNQLIEKDRKNGDAVFPIFRDIQAYQQWLQELYSLT